MVEELPSLSEVWDVLRFDHECQTDSAVLLETECQADPVIDFQTPATTICEVLQSDEIMSVCANLTSLLQFQKICESVEYVMKKFFVNSRWTLDIPSRVLLTFMKLKQNVSFACLLLSYF